jgi:hypothetical protein
LGCILPGYFFDWFCLEYYYDICKLCLLDVILWP